MLAPPAASSVCTSAVSAEPPTSGAGAAASGVGAASSAAANAIARRRRRRGRAVIVFMVVVTVLKTDWDIGKQRVLRARSALQCILAAGTFADCYTATLTRTEPLDQPQPAAGPLFDAARHHARGSARGM